ncbi:MAG: phosphoric monoester hydrolase [Methylocystis sp.]|nr:phosphoric monoester hydrolase [Methylocystis sp.]MCA3588871.1 phosphoric monoester hydrolase [Methylocystis sp.]MCA3592952.1 phosphoric monoester hydrolase [Methylocystis sp.]
MTAKALFKADPLVIAALHLPPFGRAHGMAWLEDYVATNARVFAEAGVPYIKLQDQTREPGRMQAAPLAVTAALARFLRSEVPGIGLGIIVEAHDAEAGLAIAHAAGGDFVRIKVFVGGMMTAQGPRHGIGAEALAFRHGLGRDDIAILSDVHDRTAMPLAGETAEFAAEWAQKSGADGLIITGASFDDTLQRIGKASAAGISRPILIGGSVTETNITAALGASQGVIVSSSLMRRDAKAADILRWDRDLTRRFMDAARNTRAH